MKNNRTFLEKLLNGAEVEWKKLCEVSEIEKGKQLNKALLTETGEYPVINGGINPSGYWHEYNNEANTIVISQGGASAGYVNWMTTPFFAGAHAYVVKTNETLVQKRYAYHFLKMNQVKFMQNQYGAGIPALAKSDLANLLIPIPPLSVQTEIVRILDALTALTSELTSELILRQKQYEYYREKLLSFDSLEQLNSGGGEKKLIDVAKIKNGKDWKHLGKGNIPIYGSGGIMGYVDTYAYDKPTVLIPRKGTITNIFYLEEPFWNVDTIYYTEINTTQILPKYFFYFMKTVDLAKLDTGSGRPSLTQAILNEIPIFVPPLEQQQRIVSILDKFETLTNSITEGLPLAIEQSQKRYEYYRELLLNFPGRE